MAYSALFNALYTYKAVVVSVYDGDTVTVDIDLGFRIWMRDQKVRLFGVNTPEIRGADRPRGLMVRDLVREWIEGQEVIIHSIEDRAGKYGRPLVVICPEGWTQSVNAQLIREGHGVVMAYTARDRQLVKEMMEDET